MKNTRNCYGFSQPIQVSTVLASIALSFIISGCSTNNTVKSVAKPATKKAHVVKHKAAKKASVKKVAKPVKVKAKKPAKKTVRPVKVAMKRHVKGREVKLTPQRKKAINTAVKRAIPENTKINTVVTAIQRPNRKHPSVVISHLMDGRSHNDTSARTRPEYNTIPKLARYSRQRAYDILQAIMRKTDTTNLSELVVEVNHGVREKGQRYDAKTKKNIPYSREVAQTIYATSISFEQIPKYKWQHMGLVAFSKNWKVEFNQIPFLTMTPSYQP
ncbi:MAG: hypothetical protein V3U84_11125 [Thiotrichaceae bacterium]